MNKIIQGNVLDTIKQIESKSVQCVVTSPPYWGLRDYGTNDQLGLEKTPEEYVHNMVKVFREVKRILKDDGTLWLNLGDTYSAQRWTKKGLDRTEAQPMNGMKDDWRAIAPTKQSGLPDKNLVGIPWRVAFALQSDGWFLRQDIIWHKPNPMPESVSDRCTKSHEYIFLMSKSPNYFFCNKAIAEDSKTEIEEKSNKRSVWKMNVSKYKDAHFAVFPEKLPELCIKAGSKKGDIIFDPFFGSGTTGWVAQRLSRKWIGCELNKDYIKIAKKRFQQIELF